jgi:4'-phosphopantetheinyl transferase
MPPSLIPPIADETAELWYLDTRTFEDSSMAERWLARLEEHERIRYSACRGSAAKSEYLATRVLARAALARFTGEPAERLRLTADRGRRPEMISPSMPALRWSLAKTRELAVGLFARQRDVGVDVELVAPIEAVALAGRFFSPRELTGLMTLEGAARLARFYALWTLREAYLKARGVGLTLPLEELAFEPGPAGSARAEFGPAIGDDPALWQFGLTWLTDRHLAATCIRRPSREMATRLVALDARALVGAPAPQAFD